MMKKTHVTVCVLASRGVRAGSAFTFSLSPGGWAQLSFKRYLKMGSAGWSLRGRVPSPQALA